MNKIRIIKGKTEEELIAKMNKETFFASQPQPSLDRTYWVCFIYTKETEVNKVDEQTKEEIDDPATEKQIKYLISLNVKIPKNLTKKEASKLIEENKGSTF